MMARRAMGQGVMNVVDQGEERFGLAANDDDPVIFHKPVGLDGMVGEAK